MARHNDTGKIGEAIAISYLEDKNHKVLATNWRYGKAEVDIITQNGLLLVFVEVKTRSNNRFGYPEASVGPKKEKLMMEAAIAYMREINFEEAIRFDIVAITMEPRLEIAHFEDAFFPGWNE